MITKSGPFQIQRHDSVVVAQLSASRVAAYFATHGFDIDFLDGHVVKAASGFTWQAEHFLEEHAVECVIAAWTAGTSHAAEARQQRVRELWPALATALDVLEVKNA